MSEGHWLKGVRARMEASGIVYRHGGNWEKEYARSLLVGKCIIGVSALESRLLQSALF